MEFGPEQLRLGIFWYLAFLFSTTLHEASHAFAAYRLGDPTAYEGGQVSLNPLPHIRREPFGMVLVPLLTFFWSGWMMGWASAPYDPRWAMRHPRRAAWMALAGPASNLALVAVAGVGMRMGLGLEFFVPPESLGFASLVSAPGGGPAEGLATLLSILFTLNLVLFAFNLLPVPPLDGSGALPLVLPIAAARAYQTMIRQPMLALLGIVLAWRVFGHVFQPLMSIALRLLYSGVPLS